MVLTLVLAGAQYYQLFDITTFTTPFFQNFYDIEGVFLIPILVLIGLYAFTFKYFKKTLYECKLLQIMSVLSGPLGIIAVICGWYVAEVGRQPWVVYGLLRTSEAVSDVIPENVLFSLFAHSGVCTLFFIAFIYFFFSLD